MILFILLVIVAVVALAIALTLLGVFGGAFLFTFADVIVCIAIIALIIKVVKDRKSKY